MEKTLRDLKIGESGKIISVGGSDGFRKRLIDMGVIPGSEVYVVKTAPLGDPIEIKIRGYELCIRKEDAGLITVI